MSEQRRPWVIGHRGASGYRPEHTRAAFELAFALGADAIEPDLVATRDGVLVVRHENEISGTTDIAQRPEFADRRTTKRIDGQNLTGWFTEDFTWAELATLRSRERLPKTRQHSATFDGRYPILRLSDVLEILDAGSHRHGRRIGLVAEAKHATYFSTIGIPLGELMAAELARFDGPLVVESFEETVLGEARAHGLSHARLVYLLEGTGTAPDLTASLGAAAPDYTAQLSDAGLAELAARVDGVSVDKGRLLEPDARAGVELVDRAHQAGLEVYTWTLRPENRFLTVPNRRGSAAAWGDWRAEFDAVIATGVDGVFADHPDLARAAIDER